MSSDAQPEPSRSRLTPGQQRRLRRILLMGVPVLVLLIAGFLYITSGRYVTTENAYLQASHATISPRVAGVITEVAVHENEPVEKGDLLFRIDPDPYRLAVQQAKAHLQMVRNTLKSLKARYDKQQQRYHMAHIRLKYAKRQLEREKKLAQQGLSSEAKLDKARFKVEQARQLIRITRQALGGIRARLGGNPDQPIQQLPRYQQALTRLKQAKLDLKHTRVYAPFSGIASQTPVVGRYVHPGSAVMAIVATQDLWITANFKETKIARIHPGQEVTIHVDSFPNQSWQGHVKSISPASGAQFSLLPPQNATGNWVKVVQRIPVRIAVETEPGPPRLRAGMSTTVSIDTGHYHQLPGVLGTLAAWIRPTENNHPDHRGS